MEINFHNKTVLVTGGSRGIGKSIAEDFYLNGANVYRTSTRAISQIKDKVNKNFLKTIKVDFKNKSSSSNFYEKLSQINKIDILINNAGINKIDLIDKIDENDWDNIINVNLKTPFRITQIVSKSMKKNSYGRIINLGSIFSVISKSKRASYSSSKFGIIGLTKASALDLAEKNILVNSVSPGFVNTELTKTILKAKEMKKLKSEVPLKRLATPDEISNLILFLSSDLNTYLTGQNIVIDGGYSIS